MLKIILTLSILSLAFCNVPSKSNSVPISEELRAIVVSEVMPFPDSVGNFTLYDTLYIPIYYYKDLTAYKLSYLVGEQDKNGIVHTKKGNCQYFVFANNTRYGYIYDNAYPQKHDRVSVDSMMKSAIWCEQNNFYSAFAENSIHLISSKQNKDSGLLQEVYSYKGIKDSTRNGVFSMEFTNKLQGIPYSLSRQLDSIKGMKLTKTRTQGNFQYEKNGRIIKQTANTQDDLVEVYLSRNDSIEIMNYFNRYRNEKGM